MSVTIPAYARVLDALQHPLLEPPRRRGPEATTFEIKAIRELAGLGITKKEAARRLMRSRHFVHVWTKKLGIEWKKPRP